MGEQKRTSEIISPNNLWTRSMVAGEGEIKAIHPRSHNPSGGRQGLTSGFGVQHATLFLGAARKPDHTHHMFDVCIMPEPVVGSEGTVVNEKQPASLRSLEP